MSFGGIAATLLEDVHPTPTRSTGGQRTRRGGGGNVPYSDFCRTQRNFANTLNPRVANLLKTMQDLDDDCGSGGGMGDFEPLDPPQLKEGMETSSSSSSSSSSQSGFGIPQDRMHQLRSLSALKRNKVNLLSETKNTTENEEAIEGMTSNAYDNNKLESVYMSDQEIENYYQKYVPNYQQQKQQLQLQQPQQPYSYQAQQQQQQQQKEGLMNFAHPSHFGTPSVGDDSLMQKLNYMIHLLEEKQDMKTGTAMEEMILYCFLGIFVIFLVDSFSKVGKYVR